MNLIEAIEAGAQRVARRRRGKLISRFGDNEYEACALGAAYLGCHPDVSPEELMKPSNAKTISKWVARINARISGGTVDEPDNYYLFASEWSGKVIVVNDQQTELDDYGWEATIEGLRGAKLPDGRRVGEIEVCNEPA